MRGSSSLTVRGNEIVEGFLGYRRRSQASWIYERVQGNTDSMNPLKTSNELNTWAGELRNARMNV